MPQRKKRTVVIVGCTKDSLAYGCLFADSGISTYIVDKDKRLINAIRAGRSPFRRVSFGTAIKRNVNIKKLIALEDLTEIPKKANYLILFSDATFINEEVDYSRLEKFCKDVSRRLQRGSTVIFSGRVYPGTTETLSRRILEEGSGMKAGVDFHLAYAALPRLSEKGLKELRKKIKVIGGVTEESVKRADSLLGEISKTENLRVSNMNSAEAVNLLEMVYCEVNRALCNEFSELCEKSGVDFVEVREAVNTRLKRFIPLHGFEKSDSKNLHFLIEETKAAGVKIRLPVAAFKINSSWVTRVLRLLKDGLKACNKTIRRSRVSVLGVRPKADLEGTGEKMTKILVKTLEHRGLKVNVYDPKLSFEEVSGMGYSTDKTLKQTINGRDCIILNYPCEGFNNSTLTKTKFLLRMPALILDTTDTIDPYAAEKVGFIYRGVGRGVWNK